MQKSLVLLFALSGRFAVAAEPEPTATEPVSYYTQVRPVLQAQCQGCHQPAKSSGAYVMTDFARLVSGGESGDAAVVPGTPDESYLISLITPVDGSAEMPKGKPPLSTDEIELVRQWIAQGAVDDTPANAVQRYDTEHPPVYSRPPVITSLDVSPDGTLLAVAGFHEVLLHHTDGSGLAARLIGLSERIESVAFSPDGTRLAVAGGLPERMGEVQIWDVAQRELIHSIPLTYDTVYGVSWSPDSTLIAVGCADNIVRGFKVETAEQVFFNGAHDDWALETVFSADGSHIVSVGRDMTTKLYEVQTQRFIDNVTSITPGALKGGLAAIARHPSRDEVLVGGSDGTPRIYRMHRLTKRVIGDDANLIRTFPPMRGRIYAVDFAPDGKRIACASSLDGKGQVFTYSSDYDGTLSDDLKKVLEKLPGSWSVEERKQVEEFTTSQVALLSQAEIPAAVYALCFTPDGNTLIAGGSDGTIRFINPVDGAEIRELAPIDVQPDAPRATATMAEVSSIDHSDSLAENESLPEGRTLTALEVEPDVVRLQGPWDYTQLLVSGVLDSGDRVDLTRMSTFTLSDGVGQVTPSGQVQPTQEGLGALVVQMGDNVLGVPVVAEGTGDDRPVSFVRDVMPVISRLGCNAGTCHGSKDGKKGFKLSLRGYDPMYDVRALTDDLKARRINLASPDDSLMLLKATGAVPHVGGQLTPPGEPYYEILRRWIAEGARLDLDAPRVAGIAMEPVNPVVQQIGARQQMRVVATYTDGSPPRRDRGGVHRQRQHRSGRPSTQAGVVTTLRRGEAPVLARFEGAYAATTITVMGDRTGFVWEQPETWNRIDELVADKWQRMKILPSGLCSDDEFLRRVTLDLTGLPPTADEVRAFLADARRDARQAGRSDRPADRHAMRTSTYWTNKWADLLQVNRKFLGDGRGPSLPQLDSHAGRGRTCPTTSSAARF